MITEKHFEAQVKDLAKMFGWLYYHTWRSIHSPAGFPDCVLVRPPRLIFAELKSEKGQLTDKQKEWLDALKRCQNNVTTVFVEKGQEWTSGIQPEVYIWRSNQIEEIAEILR